MRPKTLAVLVLVPLLAGCTAPASDPVSVATADDHEETAEPLTAGTAGWVLGDHFGTEIRERMSGSMVLRADGAVVMAEELDETEPVHEGRDILVRAVDWTFDGEDHFGVQVGLPSADGEETRLLPVRQADLRPTGIPEEDPALEEDPLLMLSHAAGGHAWIRFPLAEGATWEGLMVDPDTGETFAVAAEVLEPFVEHTRWGPTDVFAVRHLLDVPLDDAFVEEMLEDFREEDPEATASYDTNISYTVLWAPDLHAVVQAVARADGTFTVDWTRDGTDHSMSMDIAWTLTETLTHRDHHAVDPIPQAAYVEAVAQRALAADPVSYSLDLGPLPDPAVVGQAFETATLVDVEGTPPAPVRVVTEVVAPDGSTVAEGADALSVILDEVGWYVVAATAYAGDEPVAWKAEVVPAAAVGQAELACPMATQPEGCAALPFPVTRWAGAVEAVLQASDGSPLETALVLTDAEGIRHEAPVERGTARLMVEDMQGLTRDGRDWTAAYNATMELLPEAEVVWTVLPDDAAVPDVMPPTGADPFATAYGMRLRPILWDAPDAATLLAGTATT